MKSVFHKSYKQVLGATDATITVALGIFVYET